MPDLYLILIALVQGITEFLPISSSAHLVIMPHLLGVQDQGLAIDVAMHVGTLAAIMVYFRSETAQLVIGGIDILRGRVRSDAAKMTLLLAIATVPVVIVGLALSVAGLTDALRSMEVIGWATIIFGIALWVADKFGSEERNYEDWGLKGAIYMGLAQAIALIPGTSRSGICMTAARTLGFNRPDAARIAMLMSIPTIIASGVLVGKDLIDSGDAALGREALLAAGLSFISAILAVHLLMKMLQSWTMTPFVIYRLILGVILLCLVYT